MANPNLKIQNLVPVSIFGGTNWTDATASKFDEAVSFPDTTAGDGFYVHDTDSGQNWQGWNLTQIEALEGGVLREANIFLRFPVSYDNINAVKIEIDSTDYAGELKSAGTYGSYRWHAYRVKPNVSTNEAIDAILWLQSDTGECRVDVAQCEAVPTQHCVILRPEANHADNDGFSSHSEIGEPVFAGGNHDVDGVHGQQDGKTTVVTSLAVYTEDIEATSNGELVYIEAQYDSEEGFDYIYLDDTKITDDIGINEAIGNWGTKIYYDETDISSLLENVGFGFDIATLGTGESSGLIRCGYLLAFYSDDLGGHDRLVPVGNGTGAGPNGRWFDRMDSGFDNKTSGTGNYSYLLGNEVTWYDLKNITSQASKVKVLRGLLYYQGGSSGTNPTILDSIQIFEADQTTPLTDAADLSGITLSTALRTVIFDLPVTGSEAKGDWTGAQIRIESTNVSESDQKYFILSELEFLAGWIAGGDQEVELAPLELELDLQSVSTAIGIDVEPLEMEMELLDAEGIQSVTVTPLELELDLQSVSPAIVVDVEPLEMELEPLDVIAGKDVLVSALELELDLQSVTPAIAVDLSPLELELDLQSVSPAIAVDIEPLEMEMELLDVKAVVPSVVRIQSYSIGSIRANLREYASVPTRLRSLPRT